MKPTFKQALDCDKNVHCRICRSLNSGRAFRASILAIFPELSTVDFACPTGKPLITDPKVKPSKISKPEIVSSRLLKAVCNLPDDRDENRWLKAVVGQLQALIKKARGTTPSERLSFQRHQADKIRFYVSQYAPPAVALQFPFHPPATRPQPPSGTQKKHGCGCYGSPK